MGQMYYPSQGRVQRPDFRKVTPTKEEAAAWLDKNPRRPHLPTRAEHIACGQRIWYSGLSIGSHVRACPQRAVGQPTDRPNFATSAAEVERAAKDRLALHRSRTESVLRRQAEAHTPQPEPCVDARSGDQHTVHYYDRPDGVTVYCPGDAS